MTKLFFATDIHGSDICWSKFLNAGKFYEADVLILGGDMTGKAVVPFIHQGGKNYKVTLLEQPFEITNEDELQDLIKRVRSRGYYPYLTNPDEITELEKDSDKVHQIFLQEVLKVVQQWMDLADKKLDGTDMKVYCCPGNDDMDEVDVVIRSSRRVVLAEGQPKIELGDLPPEIRAPAGRGSAPPEPDQLTLAEVERRHILATLERCGGNRSATAQALGIGENTLWRKLKAYGVPAAR